MRGVEFIDENGGRLRGAVLKAAAEGGVVEP
jgi:hypothetical protein